ncbi:YdgA family protein [Stutzerimonas zhaodongensis]|uniref:YdgA family protein n=1 Tax=Stutzerimonas TaxID=2901164 RepID=UPI00388E092A
MKKLALAVAVPLALIGAATFYTSTQVESTARDAVDQANSKLREMSLGTGADVTVQMLSFDRGFLSSDVRYQVDVHLPDDEGNTRHYSVLMQDHLEHGPFPLSRLARGRLMPVAAQSHAQLERSPLTEKLFEAASGEVPLVSDVAIGYDGSQQGELRSAAFNLQDEQGTVRVAPGVITFDVAKDATAVRMDGELPEVDINLQGREGGKPVRFSLRNIGLSADNHEDANGFALGPSAVTLERMEIQAGDDPAMVIQNASFNGAMTEGERGLDVSTGYRIGQVDVQDQRFRNIAFVLSLRHLDGASLKALIESYTQMLDSSATPQDAFADITAAQQQALQMGAVQLLEHKPTLALDEFGFETANGAARLSVIIDLQAPSEDAFTPDAMIASMLTSLKAEAGVDKGLVRDMASLVAQREQLDVQADPAALQQQAAMTSEMFSGIALGTGWFQLQGDRLASSLHYANDKVTLNGREMSVQEFIGFAFGSVSGAGLLGQ